MILRYPGGKKKVAFQLAEVLVPCDEFREPFFGSGAVTFALLQVCPQLRRVWINDKDEGIAALFTAIIRHPKELSDLIQAFTPSVGAYREFLAALLAPSSVADVRLGFQKLAIHQMSFSGLGTKAGSPIGGWNQEGQDKVYDVGCRWNPTKLAHTVMTLHQLLKDRVVEDRCTSYDACEVISAPGSGVVLYVDPPYVGAGAVLYQYGFVESDHRRVATCLRASPHRWLLSYDDHPLVRELYAGETIETANWAYTINSKKDHDGAELLVRRGVGSPFQGVDFDALLRDWETL